MDTHGTGDISERDFAAFMLPRVYSELYCDQLDSTSALENTSTHVPVYLYLILATMFVMMLPTGVVGAASVQLLTEKHGFTIAETGFDSPVLHVTGCHCVM